MNKRFILILAAIIVLVAGFWFLTKPKASDPTTSAQPSNHVRGGGKKNVTVIEYGDFQCPACKAYYPVVEQTFATLQEDIIYQFRNFPLDSVHPNARAAARAAEAASAQGKFWEMYNKLYQNQDAWSGLSQPLPTFETYANQMGLDMVKYKSDVTSSQINAVINADISEGQKIKATSTPTFVVDGQKIEENPRDAASFQKMITDAIAKKNPGYVAPTAPVEQPQATPTESLPSPTASPENSGQ